MGAHKRPFYRIVVTDSRTRRDGRFLDIVGNYNPLNEPSTINVDIEKCKSWLGNGAQPTDTVKKLLRKAGLQLQTA
ncbi:MAG: 30S ribosomal protein S16 [Nitrospirae bacterium]|nr:30S ribosomal protein S16 [Nitrospirota bacterium]